MRCMFLPKPPSISPGENQARSSKICARATAAPRLPILSAGLSVAALKASKSSVSLAAALTGFLAQAGRADKAAPVSTRRRDSDMGWLLRGLF